MKVIHAITAFTSQYSSAENSDSTCTGAACAFGQPAWVYPRKTKQVGKE